MKTDQGFTILELLIIIAVIAILAAVLIPNLLLAKNKASDRSAKAYLRHCITAIESSRDFKTLRLPENILSCQDSGLENMIAQPPSVKNDAVQMQIAQDKYIITVEASTGAIYKYDGASILKTN